MKKWYQNDKKISKKMKKVVTNEEKISKKLKKKLSFVKMKLWKTIISLNTFSITQ